MDLFYFLDRPIAYHRVFVEITGSVAAAVMLSQAVYWSKRTTDPDGWFYKTQAEWEAETGLSRREQETARKRMAEIGVMRELLKGAPAKLYYKVDTDALAEKLTNQYGGKRQTGMAEPAKQDCSKPPSIHTENTTKTTTENGVLQGELLPAAPTAKPKPANIPPDVEMVLSVGGLTYQQAKDFVAMRKGMRAPITQTAIDRIASQAAKAGITTAAAILMCLERSWRGFQASWVKRDAPASMFAETHGDRSWADGLIDPKPTFTEIHTDPTWRDGL